jgi:hypothetical protein
MLVAVAVERKLVWQVVAVLAAEVTVAWLPWVALVLLI